MKYAAKFLAGLCLAASLPPVLAQMPPPPNKIPVIFFSDTTDDIGQRLGFNVRELLRRSSTFVLTTDKTQATLWVNLMSIRIEGSNQAAYSLNSGVYDQNAWTGSSYWNSSVGYCGNTATETCAKTVQASIDQWATEVKTRWQTEYSTAQAAQKAASAPSKPEPKKK